MIQVAPSDLAPYVAIGAVVVGIVGGFVALLKWRPEAGQMVVSTAKDAVGVLGDVLDNLEKENQRLTARVAELEQSLNARIRAIEEDRNALLVENARLRQRVKQLEDRLRGYAPEG